MHWYINNISPFLNFANALVRGEQHVGSNQCFVYNLDGYSALQLFTIGVIRTYRICKFVILILTLGTAFSLSLFMEEKAYKSIEKAL